MNHPKTCLAAALLATLSGVATAQSVQIFGVIDEYGSINRTGGKNNYRVDPNGAQASRLGFRGTEDLGGGLKAIFLLEAGLNPDTGASADATRYFNRQSWVGLSSTTWGEIRLGRTTSPQFFILGNYDAFYGVTFGSGVNNMSSYPIRYDNGATYIAPTFYAPLKLQFSTGLNETGNGRRLQTNVVAAEYTLNPVYFSVNYASTVNLTTMAETKVTTFGGNYALGAAKLFAGYEQSIASDKSLDRRLYTGSMSYDVMPLLSLIADYTHVSDKTTAGNDGTNYGLGFFYNMSKRTLFYGALAKMVNKNHATFALLNTIGAGVVPAPGQDVTGLQLGIRHIF